VQFWWLFLLFFFPFIGGVIGLSIKSEKTKQLKLFLAFSGAFLVSITILNLVPEVYEQMGHTAGYFILGGFFFQIVIDYFTQGIEHGHLHTHKHHDTFPISIFIALSVHALLEGFGVGGITFTEHTRSNLVFAIGLHELPAAFALAVVLKNSSSKKWHIAWIALYSLMVPIGMFSGYQLVELSTKFIAIIAVVIGVFLHISTTILFENTEDHTYGRKKLIAIAVGLGVALLAVNFHVH
jgi:zinc and cadmium transporter